jgi:hypothetical protein
MFNALRHLRPRSPVRKNTTFFFQRRARSSRYGFRPLRCCDGQTHAPAPNLTGRTSALTSTLSVQIQENSGQSSRSHGQPKVAGEPIQQFEQIYVAASLVEGTLTRMGMVLQQVVDRTVYASSVAMGCADHPRPRVQVRKKRTQEGEGAHWRAEAVSEFRKEADRDGSTVLAAKLGQPM